MLLPLRTDRPLRSTPVVNYALIAANVIIFLLTAGQIAQATALLNDVPNWNVVEHTFPVTSFYLHPESPHLYQFITSAFLHADTWHLLGNMLFLYVFGNSLEDRLGKVGFLGFYLGGAILSGLGHVMMETSPVLGASGAVTSVTGAYLALFPLSKVTVLFFMFIIGFIEIPSMWLIIFFFIQDGIQYSARAGGVAYLAHMTGTVYGFLLGMSLLWLRLLPREPYDMLSLWAHRRRRATFSALTQQGYRPWQHSKAAKQFEEPEKKPLTAAEQRIMDKRAQVSAKLNSHNMDRAGEMYAELLDLDAGQVFSLQQQTDLANHFVQMGRHELAARAYELLLDSYRTFPNREQVQLMLAVIYVRYLRRGDRARQLILDLQPRLVDSGEKELAGSLLKQIGMA
ncbi:MAG: rhomboid family intramembrane serine protease [Phycisphaeraceae bacterium]